MDNGKEKIITCDLNSWAITEKQMSEALEQVASTYSIVSALIRHTEYLPSIAKSNEDIKNSLISAAVGKDHVPLTIVERLVKIFGWAIFGLITVIVFLLTGSTFGWFPRMH